MLHLHKRRFESFGGLNVRILCGIAFFGAALIRVLWAQQPIGPTSGPTKSDTCMGRYGGCVAECARERKGGWITEAERVQCYAQCKSSYTSCMAKPARTGAAGATKQTPPPKATPSSGLTSKRKSTPTPTPTPRSKISHSTDHRH